MSNGITEEQVPSKVGNLLTRDTIAWLYRGGFVLLITFFWLYSDRHNDDRYLGMVKYASDIKENSEKQSALFSTIATLQNQKNTDHDSLVEMKNDIKWIREHLTAGKE